MTYIAFSRRGPRLAIAISDDLLHWRRLGLAKFHPYDGIAFDGVDDKDASVFPLLIRTLPASPPSPCASPAGSWNTSGRKGMPTGILLHGYSPGKHLDLI